MTQRGQSVATPEQGTAPGRARAPGLAQEGQVIVSPHSDLRQDDTVRNMLKGNKKVILLFQFRVPKGMNHIEKRQESTQPIQTRLTIAHRRQPEYPEVHIANTMTTYKCHTERKGAPSFADRRPCQPLSHRAPFLCNFTEMEFTITKTLNPYRT